MAVLIEAGQPYLQLLTCHGIWDKPYWLLLQITNGSQTQEESRLQMYYLSPTEPPTDRRKDTKVGADIKYETVYGTLYKTHKLSFTDSKTR